MGEVFQEVSLPTSQSSTSDRMASALSALGESATFGRFLSESLDWGRWSSFDQKKYIEEAERHSQPGSVAQKKALFEARYSRTGAPHLRRSIALMQRTPSLTRSNDFDPDDSVSGGREECTVDSFYSAVGDSVNFDSKEEEGEEADNRVVEDSGVLDSCPENIAMPNSPEKQPLQESSVTNQPVTEEIPRTPINSTKIPKPSFSPSPLSKNKSSYLHCIKENISSSSKVGSQECNSVERKRSKLKSVHASINHSIGGGSTPSVCGNEGSLVERKRSTPKSIRASTKLPIGEGSTPSKADVKTKIARFEAVSKTTQSSMFSSKAAKAGFPKLVPKCAPLTPQSEPRKMAWDRRSSFSGRKTDAVGSGNLSTEILRGTSNNVDRLKGESTASFSRKSDKKEENEEMTNNEMRVFRQSLCFKARPLPDFYRKMEPTKESNLKLQELTRISSSKEKLNPNDNSVPSQKPPLSRSSSSKNYTGAPNVASISKDQKNKWTFTFSRR